MGQQDLRPALQAIDPRQLSYQDWLNVGMALKDEGYSCEDWDTWSRQDPERYHDGECFRKWASFRGAAAPVTGGTIVQLARAQGFVSAGAQGGYELDWNSEIDTDDLKIVDTGWLESKEVEEPRDWDPARQLIRYLETLFDADETVGFVTESWQKDEKYLPTKGVYSYTAGQLIENLSRCGGDLGAVLGDYNPAAGAWIRFNPLDGSGVKNENVTEFRYALVESDTMDIERQNAVIRELELPVACLVHSGGKSLHAIVRVEAANYTEYRQRVDYLYSVLKKNGMSVDTQNKNPSRLSRMPGVLRNGRKQFLVDTNLGKESWAEWKEWVEGVNDDLPDQECLAELWGKLPELAPQLIQGVLRHGHKLLLTGPSKAGKSFALIQLCIAIAEGWAWMGFPCACGRVLYVNLELDRASCLHRFQDVYEALGRQPEHLENLDLWNLRGKSVPMDKLAPKLIRRAMKKNYTAIVIDPIYKVITGDENSADQMANFCNQFDKVCTELGCAVIYCHHHSKGTQAGKRSMDRASGSGVFARDPDALLDMIELPLNEDIQAQRKNKARAAALTAWLRQNRENWRELASQDDQESAAAMEGIVRAAGGDLDAALALARQAEAVALMESAWRIEGTLREFPRFPPVNCWFSYPVHRLDESGVLGDVTLEDTVSPWKRPRKEPRDRKRERLDAMDTAFAACDMDGSGEVSQRDLMDYTGKAKSTIQNWVDEHPGYTRENGVIRRVQTSKSDP